MPQTPTTDEAPGLRVGVTLVAGNPEPPVGTVVVRQLAHPVPSVYVRGIGANEDRWRDAFGTGAFSPRWTTWQSILRGGPVVVVHLSAVTE